MCMWFSSGGVGMRITLPVFCGLCVGEIVLLCDCDCSGYGSVVGSDRSFN